MKLIRISAAQTIDSVAYSLLRQQRKVEQTTPPKIIRYAYIGNKPFIDKCRAPGTQLDSGANSISLFAIFTYMSI